MEVLKKTISSITSQNLLGWLVIGLILIIFIIGIVLSFLVKKYYDELNNDIVEGIAQNGDINFSMPEVKKIVARFKRSTECGTDNINTQVIIEKHLSDKYVRFESTARIIPSILIAMGLLGTFLGLTLAIFETKTALSGITTINNFTKELQSPIASMATAFWTSIFGVITSMISNFIINTMKHSKNKFYNEIEDYLDNEIFANHAKTFNTIFEEFSRTVKLTMLTLTEEMTNLFKDGVEELVSKINTSSIDLTESANGLKEYTKEFKGLVEVFDGTVRSFQQPVASFNKSVSEFVVTSENLSESVDTGFKEFVRSTEYLDKSMIDLSTSIDTSFEAMSGAMDVSLDNLSANLGQCFTGISIKFEGSMGSLRESIDDGLIRISSSMVVNAESNLEVAATIKDESVNMVSNQESIKALIEDIQRSNEVSNKEISYQNIVINKQSKSLEEAIKSFNRSTEHMPIYVAERFSSVLKDYLDDVGINIKNHLDDRIGTISTDIFGASRTLDETIKVIDDSRDIINNTSNYRRRRE